MKANPRKWYIIQTIDLVKDGFTVIIAKVYVIYIWLVKKTVIEDLRIVNRDRNSSVISVCIPRDVRTVYSNIYGDVGIYCCHDLAV